MRFTQREGRGGGEEGEKQKKEGQEEWRVVSGSARRSHLHNGLLAVNLQHLSRALLAVLQREVDDLGVLGQLHVVENDQRTLHCGHGRVVCTTRSDSTQPRMTSKTKIQQCKMWGMSQTN